jgi:hypothetical protein
MRKGHGVDKKTQKNEGIGYFIGQQKGTQIKPG